MAAWVRLAEPPEFFRATVCRAATPSTPMARISTDTITSIRLMPCWDLRAMDGMLLLTMSVVSRPGARSGGCTPGGVRAAERRVGKAYVSTCRTGWWSYMLKKQYPYIQKDK